MLCSFILKHHAPFFFYKCQRNTFRALDVLGNPYLRIFADLLSRSPVHLIIRVVNDRSAMHAAGCADSLSFYQRFLARLDRGGSAVREDKAQESVLIQPGTKPGESYEIIVSTSQEVDIFLFQLLSSSHSVSTVVLIVRRKISLRSLCSAMQGQPSVLDYSLALILGPASPGGL